MIVMFYNFHPQSQQFVSHIAQNCGAGHFYWWGSYQEHFLFHNKM